MSTLDAPYFKNDTAARKHLERIRWPNGPYCPHCGCTERIKVLNGKSHRAGLHKCYDCSGHFTVTVGTLFERSKIPLHKWFMATYLLCSSKKGISSHQLHRMLGITYKSAWFMSHRIREAMREHKFAGPLGRGGGTVEIDETYWGRKKGEKVRPGYKHKEKILTLVERGGELRSFHVPEVNSKTLRPILRQQISQSAHVKTDEAGYYRKLRDDFSSHEAVSHQMGEYVRGDAHTNTLEGYFSILKRGLTGVYQHVASHHLKRYVGEFDFRYNTRDLSDWERSGIALKGIGGKRLTYGGPEARSNV